MSFFEIQDRTPNQSLGWAKGFYRSNIKRGGRNNQMSPWNKMNCRLKGVVSLSQVGMKE